MAEISRTVEVLRWMAIASPVVIVVTAVVTLRHLWLHHIVHQRAFDQGQEKECVTDRQNKFLGRVDHQDAFGMH